MYLYTIYKRKNVILSIIIHYVILLGIASSIFITKTGCAKDVNFKEIH